MVGKTAGPRPTVRRKLARIVRDEVYPQMWRVEFPDGSRSDMVNRARAKDAARTHALTVGRRTRKARQTPSEAPAMR